MSLLVPVPSFTRNTRKSSTQWQWQYYYYFSNTEGRLCWCYSNTWEKHVPWTDRLHSAWKGWCIPNRPRNSLPARHKAAGLDSGLRPNRSDSEVHHSDKGFHRRNNLPKPGLENQPSQVIQTLAWVQKEYFLSYAISLFCDVWQMSWHLFLHRLCPAWDNVGIWKIIYCESVDSCPQCAPL